MFPYIYTEQNGIHVIDLVQTARLLSHAYNYVQKAAKEGKTFLFIGTKRQAKNIIAEEATKCGSFFVDNRWLGGTLTNWSTVQGRVDYLKDLNQREASGELDRLPKKEAALLRREHDKLKNNFTVFLRIIYFNKSTIFKFAKKDLISNMLFYFYIY
jgi:small subunit ribosomal protein S2